MVARRQHDNGFHKDWSFKPKKLKVTKVYGMSKGLKTVMIKRVKK